MGWAPRRLRDRTLLSYVPAILLTLAAAVSVARAFGFAFRYSEEVRESTQLLLEGNELRGSIVSAQSSVRGFAITGRERYLEPYRSAEQELLRKRATAGTTWAARPMQRAQVIRALDLFFQWKHETAEPVIAARRPPVGETAVLLQQGRPVVERANQLLGEVIESERHLLQVRSARNESAARWGMIIVIAAPLVVLTYVLLASYLMTRRTVGAVESVSRAALAFSAGDLSHRVRSARTDELGSLARAFDAMAERLALRSRETTGLSELAQMLQVTRSEREVGELFERFTRQLLPVCGARLYAYDAEKREFLSTLSWGPPGPESFPEVACWGVRLGKPYHSTGHDGPPCEHLGEVGERRSLCLPMVVQGEELGLIQYVYESDAEDAPILRIGTEIAERCAFTISNIRLRQRLREQSIRDPLTGLLNRRYLEEAFEREIERARRLGRPLGVLMIDIDHFKEVNDAAGHAAGDALLRAFGTLLVSAFRAGDEAYRYGGEEFLVLMPDAAIGDVIERARMLQTRIAHLHVAFDGGTVPSITASMGTSAYPEDGDSPATLIRAADDALYRAKQAGRNRIVAPRSEHPTAREGSPPDSPHEP